MSWFRKPKQKLVSQRRETTADVFDKCPSCAEILYRGRLEENHWVCTACGHHLRLLAPAYIELLLDNGFEEEIGTRLRSADPLHFTDSKPYETRIQIAQKKATAHDAILTGRGKIDGREVFLGVMDFRFIGGSMGTV